MVRKSSGYAVPLKRSEYVRLDPHADHVTNEAGFAAWAKRKTDAGERLAVDLFTGAGGLSYGIQQAGWTMAAGIDFNDRAVETHAHNFPGLSLVKDLGDPTVRDELVDLLSKAEIDLVAGGPPCQPFSLAGRNKIRSLVREHGRNPEDARKELWQAYLDIVERLEPRAVLMENVPDMGLQDDFAVVRIIEERLERRGYAVDVRIAAAWKYGVPQHRRRLILLARNDVEAFPWPEPRPRVTLDEAIGDLPRISVAPLEGWENRPDRRKETPKFESYRDMLLPVQYVPKRRPYVHVTAPTGAVGAIQMAYEDQGENAPAFTALMRRKVPAEYKGVVFDHHSRRVREDDFQVFEKLTTDLTYADLDGQVSLRYDTDKFKDKYHRLRGDDLSRTITAHLAKDGYWYIHPSEHRTLTAREAARVQTFPDSFRFAGTRSDAFRQIGNAVPPLLGEAAATALRPLPDHESLHTPTVAGQVRESLNAWAAEQKIGSAWFRFPGPEMGPVQAAVMAVLSGSKPASEQLGSLMAGVRDAVSVTDEMLDGMKIQPWATKAVCTKLERLRKVTGETALWTPAAGEKDTPEEIRRVSAAVGLKPAEQKLYTVLRNGPDLLLDSAPSQRVAARVAGSTSHLFNRGTEGRVDLSRLIGADDNAALRVAAVHLIGQELCKVARVACGACPLQKFCLTAQDPARLKVIDEVRAEQEANFALRVKKGRATRRRNAASADLFEQSQG